MTQAYARLKRLLGERNITVPGLQKRIQQRGMDANLESLYRLSREPQPLARSELITFETLQGTLHRFSAAKQKRLDTLMTKNDNGQLTDGEREERRVLVREAEEITLANARILAGQH
jgi:hypothetical protein